MGVAEPAGQERILITGATSAIGGELALYYAKPGTELTLHGRNAAILEPLAERCRQALSRYLSHKFAPSGPLFAFAQPQPFDALRTELGGRVADERGVVDRGVGPGQQVVVVAVVVGKSNPSSSSSKSVRGARRERDRVLHPRQPRRRLQPGRLQRF